MPNGPLCFVIMPFGRKPDGLGTVVDFDAVYDRLIRPAIEEVGLSPLRADEEVAGGMIHKPMFERLILCEYAVADLTSANANVFYELGVRHAVRPRTTVPVFAEGARLPFDVAPLRALPYRLAPDGNPVDVDTTRAALAERLRQAKATPMQDSPLFQLLQGYPEVDHTKTDVFRERVEYSQRVKERLARARKAGAEAVAEVEQELEPLANEEAGVVVDLYLSYRAVRAWDRMIALVERMSPPLRETALVQEQLGLALNRSGRGDEAERVLRALIERRGPSSETFGILGRVYKDRWDGAVTAGDDLLARGLLDRAIDAYVQGFEADWRDAYPGVNAVTLMEIRDPPDPRREKLLPVVYYAVERRIAAGQPDYWDHATLLELAVLRNDRDGAGAALADAVAVVREPWEPETTARNLRLIRQARAQRGEEVGWVDDAMAALERRAAPQLKDQPEPQVP